MNYILSEQQNNFLWYSLFGITEREAEKDKEKALSVCINRAYRDLNRTLAYKYSSSKLDDMKRKSEEEKNEAYLFEKDKKSFTQKISEKILGKIDELISSNNIENFTDDWHKPFCTKLFSDKELVDSVFKKNPEKREGTRPNIGIAQKWINMTIKYMLIMGLWDDTLENYKKELHIPLDSYILNAAAQSADTKIYEDMDVKGLGVNNSIGKWSQIEDYCKYSDYQRKLHDIFKNKEQALIDWESEAWIAEAKKENNKNEN